MIRSWLSRIAATFLIVGLSACSALEKWHEGQHASDEVDTFERRIYVDGVAVPTTGADILDLKNNRPEKFNDLIDNLIGVDESIDKIDNRDGILRDFARFFPSDVEYRRSSGSSPLLQQIEDRIIGIGGFSVRLLLNYLLVCDDSELRDLGDLRVVGKIDNWLYDKKATVTTNGKDGNKGSGLIFWKATIKDCKGVKHDYRVHIAVEKAYELWENLEAGAELRFASDEINEMIPEHERERNRAEGRRFDYKLHARGKRIHVLSVLLDNNLVDRSDPIYVSDPDSCIDIFFEGKIGATKLPSQSDYCMGRCEKPPIINTGGGD